MYLTLDDGLFPLNHEYKLAFPSVFTAQIGAKDFFIGLGLKSPSSIEITIFRF
jgi:hypothetical protein